MKNPFLEMEKRKKRIHEKTGKFEKRIVILSGKGGVGKSFVSALISYFLSKEKKVFLFDADIHGPSIPKIFNLSGKLDVENEEIIAKEVNENLKVMSLHFLLEKEKGVIWRGPLKSSAITELLEKTRMDGDVLVVDLPPGTGDEALTIAQLINPTGIILVTQPSELSELNVLRASNFAKELNIKILGVVENMSYLICPNCGKKIELFKGNGGEFLAKKLETKFFGKIPFLPKSGIKESINNEEIKKVLEKIKKSI